MRGLVTAPDAIFAVVMAPFLMLFVLTGRLASIDPSLARAEFVTLTDPEASLLLVTAPS
jgi:hypothetical protein